MVDLPDKYDEQFAIEYVTFEGYYIIDKLGIDTKVSMNWHNIEIDDDEIYGHLSSSRYRLIPHKMESQTYFISATKSSNGTVPHVSSSAGVNEEKYRVLEATADYHNNVDLPIRSKKTSKDSPKEILERKLDTDNFKVD